MERSGAESSGGDRGRRKGKELTCGAGRSERERAMLRKKKDRAAGKEAWTGSAGLPGLGRLAGWAGFWFPHLLSFPISILFQTPHKLFEFKSKLNSNSYAFKQLKLCTSLNAQHVEPKLNFSYLRKKNLFK